MMKDLGRAWAPAMALLAGAALALPCGAIAAAVSGEGRGEPAGAVAPTFGRTLPPIGFVEFCRREAEACRPQGYEGMRPRLTGAQWESVARVNAFVNARIEPEGDQDLYGEPEHWAYPTTAGDCEDYVLLKQRYLEAFGIPRAALLITVVLDDQGEGHAVLMLATSEGDFVLDNRRNAIRRWKEAGYTFLKRQSQHNPRDWVSLANGSATSKALAIRSATP
jgi:predicted transglutaminase-like cysteine proteinase